MVKSEIEMDEFLAESISIGDLKLTSSCLNCQQLGEIAVALLRQKEIKDYLHSTKLRKETEKYLG